MKWIIFLISSNLSFYSCSTSHTTIFGKYKNKDISSIKSGSLLLKGIKRQAVYFSYIELKPDSTFYAPNCYCESKGIYTVKNDSLTLINETQGEKCIPEITYKIRKDELVRKGEIKNSLEILTKNKKRQSKRYK